MNYGDLIKDALWISWRNKYLWFFGFIVAGGYSYNFNLPSGNFDFKDFKSNDSSGAISSLAAWMGGNGSFPFVLIALIILVTLVLVIVFIALSVISRGALAESVAALKRGETRRFGTAWRAGTSNAWRVLGQAILFFLIGLGLLLVVSLVVVLPFLLVFVLTQSLGTRIAAGVLLGLLGVVLLILVFLPLYIVGQLALRKLVVDGERIGGSIGSGYALFRANLGKSLLTWLVFLGVSLGVGIAALIVFFILGIVLIGPSIALFIGNYTTAGIAAGIVGGLIFLVPFLVISGALGTFGHAYWTLAYLQLTTPPDHPIAESGLET